MGPDAALPLSLTILLICANPMAGDERGEGGLASVIEHGFLDGSQVVAASPVPAGIGVGSHYGWRTSTRTGDRTFHAGTDFLAPAGTPVYAVRAGVVEAVVRERDGRRFAGYGNAIVVRHEADGRWTLYAHLARVDVEEGQYVLPGHKLGDVGNTSNGRFPNMVAHLHFEVREARRDGASPFPGPYGRHDVNPEAWLAEMGVRFEHVDHDHDHDHDEDAPMLVLARDPAAPAPVLAGSGFGTATF